MDVRTERSGILATPKYQEKHAKEYYSNVAA